MAQQKKAKGAKGSNIKASAPKSSKTAAAKENSHLYEIIAIIAIPIGYAILNAGKKKNSSDENLFPGCLGLIFIGGGIVCLLPLVAWLCSILSAIFAIGLVIFIAIGIIALIFSKNK